MQGLLELLRTVTYINLMTMEGQGTLMSGTHIITIIITIINQCCFSQMFVLLVLVTVIYVAKPAFQFSFSNLSVCNCVLVLVIVISIVEATFQFQLQFNY